MCEPDTSDTYEQRIEDLQDEMSKLRADRFVLLKACRATLEHLSTSSKLDWDGELTAIIEAAIAAAEKGE